MCGGSVHAADPIATARFYDKGVVEENMTAVCSNNPVYTNSVREGVHGWYMDVYEKNNSINFAVLNTDSDDYGKNYRLDVTYYDEKSGYFTLIYNTSEGKETKEHVVLTGSNEWKTHSFYLYDAYFNKSIYGKNDFRLTVYDPEYTYSDFGVLINKAELYSLGTKAVTSVKMKESGRDTIFFGEEEISLDIAVENKTDAFNGTIIFKIFDDSEKTIYSEQRNIKVNAGSNEFNFKPKLNSYGVFKAEVKVKSGQKAYESIESFSFSRINTDYGETVNDEFGVTAHMGYVSRSYDADLHTTLMKNSGMGIVRDEVKWVDYEKEKGVYKLQSNHVEEMQQLKAKGIEQLLILGFSNPLYIDRYGRGVKDYPLYENELKAFYDYVYNLVSSTKGYVKYFEVWNEYNHNNSDMTTAEYVNILKTAYTAAKAANPECKIVGMVFCSTRTIQEMEAAIALGAMDYMDIVSTHYYSVNEAKQSPETSYLNTELRELKKLCGDKELWLSETGWSTNHRWITDEECASYATRLLLWNEYKGYADKIMWYDWHDDGTLKNYIEHNYGMLNNDYSSKRVYAAISSYNKNIASATYSDIQSYESLYMYKLIRQNGNKIYAVYDCNNEKKEIALYTSAPEVTLTDNYGNKKDVIVENGMFKIEVSGFPVYIESSEEELYWEDNIASVDVENSILKQYGMEINGTDVGASSEIFADVISVGNFDGYKNIEVDVTFDGKAGDFITLCYDSVDGEEYAETVCIKESEKPQTHTFLLQNARFGNRLNGLYDFKLSGTDRDGNVLPDLIKIKNITVRDTGKICGVHIEVEDTVFNLYEPQDIKVDFNNVIEKACNAVVRYTVFRDDGSIYKEYEKRISIDAFGNSQSFLKTDISECGSYTLKIEVIDRENNIYSVKNTGITIKKTSYGRYNLERLAINADVSDLSKLKNNGAKILYTKIYRDEVEKEKGVYELPEKFCESIKQLSAEGFDIIIETDYISKLYPDGDKSSFENYISALAEKTGKYCNTFALRSNDFGEAYISFVESAKNALDKSGCDIKLAAEEIANDYADILILTRNISLDKPVILVCNDSADVLSEYLNFIKTTENGLFLIERCADSEYAKLSSMSSVLENCRFIGTKNDVFEFADEKGKSAYVVYSKGNGEDITLETEYKNIAFLDEFGNLIKEDASENCIYTVNSKNKLIFAVQPKEKVWIDYPTQTVYIKDIADNTTEETNINITVFSENAKKDNPFGIVYLDQQKTDRNGEFNIAFDVSEGDGAYRAVVTNNSGMNKEYNIKLNRIVDVNILIKDENGNEITQMSDIKDIKSEKLYISAEIDNSVNTKHECMVMVCGYKNDMLKFCSMENGSLNGAFELNLSLQIDAETAKKADSIKIFILNENSFECLTNNIHLN